MFGVAAFAAALTAAVGHHPGLVFSRGSALLTAPRVHLVALPAPSPRGRSCSAQRSQPSGVERKVLPVACEQPPRSSVAVPNGVTGGLGSILGTGR